MDRNQSPALPRLLATPEPPPPTRLLRRREASAYLKATWGIDRAISTLNKLACIGGGPAFCRDGRIPLYAPSDLDDWARSKIGPKLTSTSDKGGAA
jgi:hypothetical protein